jgi:hypothetical protein
MMIRLARRSGPIWKGSNSWLMARRVSLASLRSGEDTAAGAPLPAWAPMTGRRRRRVAGRDNRRQAHNAGQDDRRAASLARV